jgi:hypothetical protein
MLVTHPHAPVRVGRSGLPVGRAAVAPAMRKRGEDAQSETIGA